MNIRLFIKYFFYTTILVLLQILLFNYISLGTGLVPYVYFLIILLLPLEVHKLVPLLFGFFLGLFIDILNDTVALHTGAMVFAGYLRPFVLQILSPEDGYETGKLPSFYNFGLGWFLSYSLILMFFHQLVYFSLDIFMLSKIGLILLKTVINTLYSVTFIVIIHLLFLKNK